jgi:hypothetical protein
LRLFMNVNFRLSSPRLLVVCCNQSCYITGDFGLVRKSPMCTNHLHTTLNPEYHLYLYLLQARSSRMGLLVHMGMRI